MLGASERELASSRLERRKRREGLEHREPRDVTASPGRGTRRCQRRQVEDRELAPVGAHARRSPANRAEPANAGDLSPHANGSVRGRERQRGRREKCNGIDGCCVDRVEDFGVAPWRYARGNVRRKVRPSTETAKCGAQASHVRHSRRVTELQNRLRSRLVGNRRCPAVHLGHLAHENESDFGLDERPDDGHARLFLGQLDLAGQIHLSSLEPIGADRGEEQHALGTTDRVSRAAASTGA